MLVGYFGERLEHCTGCDRCRRRPVPHPEDGPEVVQRLARLRAAMGAGRGAWGAALLEPEVLLALARRPPADSAELADIAGVGPTLAGTWGGAILRALGRGSGPTLAAQPATARRLVLAAWRRRTAREAGVPEYAILGNAALETLAAAPTPSLAALGPRARAKYGDELLRLVAAYGPDHYLPPVDQGDAEILERIEAGERMFRPGTVGDRARQIFESLVEQLRGLRELGLIDMPERSVAYATDDDAGAYLMAGPCYVTEAGRTALQEFRRGNRRRSDRRSADRRGPGGAPLPTSDVDRRTGGDRRQSDRRH